MIVLMLVGLFAIVQIQQLVLRDSPNISTIIESVDYLTDDEKFNLQDAQLDIVIELEIHSSDKSVDSRSWDALDEKFGRIIAQQVEVTWSYDKKGRSESHRE